jgi:DNA phosphorothioation-dependent restriction protein DptH
MLKVAWLSLAPWRKPAKKESKVIGDFIGYLVSKIRAEAGHFISSENNNLRVTFSAPPAGILDEIYDRFDAMGPRLELESDDHVMLVPVLRVQEGIEDPSHQNTTRCSSNHVVAIRTSYGSYLALSTINSPPLLSTDTTANKLGLNRVNHVSFSTWREEPFVQDVFEAVLSRFKDVPVLEKELAWEALEEAFIESAQAGDMQEPWELLRALYDLGGNGKTSRDLCHALGVPRLEDDESPEPRINYDIANYMQAHGFTAGMHLLQEDADSEEVSEALNRLSQDFVMLYRTPQRFVTRPLGNYAKAGNAQGAQWWHILSQSVWIELLHQEESKSLGSLKVSCANELFRPTLTSQLTVVKSSPQFLLRVDEELVGEELSVYRASGRKTLDLIETITISDLETQWNDESWPFDHEQYVRYEFICNKQEKPATFKLISLESYLPAVVLNCRSAQKLTPFKKKRVGRGAKTTNQYECELVTNGTGTQTIEFFYRNAVSLPLSIHGRVGEGDNANAVDWSLTTSGVQKGHALAVIEISEDCQITFDMNLPELDGPVKYILNISANEFTAKGASSEFDKLVTNNCTRSDNVAKTDVEQSLLTLLEQWILESEDSYQPLVFGPGFKESWHQPDWAARPQMSNLHLSLDPRPRADELAPPAGYLQARKQARELLKKLCDVKGCTIEALSLGQLMLDKDNRSIIERYVCEYADWLSAPNSLAAWADLITVHKAQQQSHFLESKPLAVLLSPFHPVRLAWQCNAQQLMQDSINEGLPCPVAGIIEPYSFPDCLALRCRDMDGRFNPAGFVAVKSSSDYWSVLWRADLITEVSQGNHEGVFGNDLGLKIEGMVNGFNRQQVRRSLDEIRHLYPAKSTLRISLHSDSSGYSSCNDGIDEWCLENLGPDADEWSPAHGLTLQIIDKRPREEQPKPAVLASLTERSGTKIRWYTNSKGGHAERDLSIVDHLQTMDQAFRKDGVLSPVDPTCVSRISIKKNAAAHRQYLSLSRAGQFVSESSGDVLQDNLSRALELLESACVNDAQFDSLSFAPNLQTLNNSLRDTRYSAISSSAVDATCFHSPGKDAYLWDFELPRYAPGAGQSCGFYLVAKQSPTMVTAVRNVLKQLPGTSDVSDEQVASLLDEVSRRGIPTLKRLTSGGSASLGEVGMLIAARLLQSDFQRGSEGKGLVPAIGNRMVNLVIPADVFQPRFDELRKALGAETRERPDLLVLSIAFGIDAGDELLEPNALKITPIEVKARSTEMTERQRDEALTQAKSFAGFLHCLKERGSHSTLWGIAYRDLIASWLDYGFRVYGETEVAQATPHWVHYHQQTIARLMSNKLEVELDPEGRLISIENTDKSRVLTTGKSSLKNTAVLGYELAGALLAGNQPQVVADMVKQVGDWGLLAINSNTEKAINSPENQVLRDKKEPLELTKEPSSSNESLPGVSESSSQSAPLDNKPETTSPEAAAGLNFKIGCTKDLIGSKEVIFYPGNTELNNINIGVVGDLGTGKTQLLKSLVYQMVKQPEQNRGEAPKVLILDYKRDFSDKEDSCQFINKAKVKVVSPYKIPLNLFATAGDSSSRTMLDKIGFFRDILRKIFSVNAPVQDKNLKEAIKAAYQRTRDDEGRDPTIYDVFKHYEAIVDRPDSVSGIISDMVDYEIFEDDPAKIVSFDEFFEGVVAIDLKELSDEKLKKMVVVIFLNLYFDYMLRVKKRPFLGKDPQTRFIDSYLLVDEAHNIMPYEFEVLTKLLVQGRAFGVGVILASQYFSHFKTTRTDYLEPIGSWFIHQVPGLAARDLDKIGLPAASDSMVNRISGLEKFNSLCKTLDWSGEFIEEVPFYKLD